MKRRKIGNALGTSESWQAGVVRMLLKMCRIHAWRSDLMTDGKTAEESTSAVKPSISKVMTSDVY